MINTHISSKKVGYFVLSAILVILITTTPVSANIFTDFFCVIGFKGFCEETLNELGLTKETIGTFVTNYKSNVDSNLQLTKDKAIAWNDNGEIIVDKLKTGRCVDVELKNIPINSELGLELFDDTIKNIEIKKLMTFTRQIEIKGKEDFFENGTWYTRTIISGYKTEHYDTYMNVEIKKDKNIHSIQAESNLYKICFDSRRGSEGKYNLLLKNKNEKWDNSLLTNDPWYSASWERRIQVRMADNDGGSATNLVIPVNATDLLDTAGMISDGDLDSACNSIRFIDDDDTTVLTYRQPNRLDDTYGCNLEDTLFWVEVPTYNGTGDYFWLYFGATTEDRSEGDFESLSLLYSLDGNLSDMSNNSLNGTATADYVAGQVGKAQHIGVITADWDGVGLSPGEGNFSVCWMVKHDDDPTGREGYWDGVEGTTSIFMENRGDLGDILDFRYTDSTGSCSISNGGTMVDTDWNYLCYTHNSTSCGTWINGKLNVAADSTTGTYGGVGDLKIGQHEAEQPLDGSIDIFMYSGNEDFNGTKINATTEALFGRFLTLGDFESFPDANPPLVLIEAPIEEANYSSTNITLNVTCRDDATCDTHFYELNLGGNTTFEPNTTLTAIEGSNILNYCANDTSDNWNCTFTRTFTVDTTFPLINITYPLNSSYSTDQTELNFSFIETNPDTCWYSTDLGVTNTTITCGDNVTGLSSGDGDIKWFAYVNDTAGNDNQTAIDFLVDTLPPFVQINNPSNITYNTLSLFLNTVCQDITSSCTNQLYDLNDGGNVSFTPISQVAESFDTDISEIDILIGQSGGGARTQASQTFFNSFQFTTEIIEVYLDSFSAGFGNLTAEIWTTSGGSPDTLIAGATGTVTEGSLTEGDWNNFTLSTQPTLDSLTTYAIVIFAGVDSGDDKLVRWAGSSGDSFPNGECFEKADGAPWVGQSKDCSFRLWMEAETIVGVEGDNTLEFCADDTSGHLNCTATRIFIVDTTFPEINITHPLNISYTIDQTELNFSFIETNPDTCWYSTDLGFTNTTLTCGDNVTGLSSGEDNTKWFAYVNDTAGNENQANISFFVDTISPQINITHPVNRTYTSIQTELNSTALDISSNLDTCWYSTDLGITNTTFICGNNITGLNSGQGDIKWFSYVNDTLNNENQTDVDFFVDSIKPELYVESPANISYGFRTIDLNVTGTDTNLDGYYYSLNSGSDVVFTANTTITSIQGDNNINITVNDTVGNIASQQIFLYANDTTILPFTLFLNSTTIEGRTETYYTNITFNPVSIADINVTFNYNNTNYTAARTNLTDNHIEFKTTFNVPGVSATTTKTLYAYVDQWFVNGSKGGNYTTSATQTIDTFYLYYCETGENASSYLAYNFSFREEYNNTLLNQSDIRANFNIWTTDLSVNSTILIDKTNVPDLPVCVSPPDYIFNVDSTIEYEKSGFVKRFYYLDNDETSANSTTNISLYLLDDDDDTHVTFTIANNLLAPIEHALLYVQKYYPSLDAYKTVAMGKTSDEGEAIVPLKLYDTIYKFIVTEAGETTHTSGNTQLDQTTYTIITRQTSWGDEVREFDDVSYELSWDNDTEIATLTWSVSTLESRSFCLKCTKLTPRGDSIIFDDCKDSVSDTLSCSLPDDGEYTVIFYGKGSHKVIDLLDIVKGQVRVLAGKLGLDGVVYTVLVSGTLGAIGVATGSAILAILGTIIGVIAMSAIGFIDIGFGIIIGLVIVGIIALWRVQK